MKILDFGLAKLVQHRRSEDTATDETPHFLSPEQSQSARDDGPATDDARAEVSTVGCRSPNKMGESPDVLLPSQHALQHCKRGLPPMSTAHVTWSSIELLHNVVRTLGHLHELGHPLPVVEYRAKVKLHGSNCAVQVTGDSIIAQSRTSLLSPEADYKGFATWVRRHEAYFQTLPAGIVVFGEWCGPGVEKGMAISAAPTKLFVVFAVQVAGKIVYEPEEVRALVPAAGAPGELHVLPWEGEPVRIDYGAREALEAVATELNGRVSEVERCDPWAKKALGISGLGEGLVLYPVSVNGAAPPADPEGLAQLMFKAKGEKHRTAGTKTAVSVDAAVVASVDEFVALMVTEARLAQGLAAVGAKDAKLTGKFLEWIVADVRKESAAELEASSLTFAQVEKAVRVCARTWYLSDTSS